MIRTNFVRLGAATLIGAAALGLSGCGNVVDADNAQKSVTAFVTKSTKFTPEDVTCPADVEAKVGVEFDCTFTGPDGNYLAHLTITKADGSEVEYDVVTKLA